MKDAIIVACVLAMLLIPLSAKKYLTDIGITSVSTPIGEIKLAKEQIKNGTAALTVLEDARRQLEPDSPALAGIDNAIQSIQDSTIKAQDVISESADQDPTLSGWLYLGTVGPSRTTWLPGVPGRTAPTVREQFLK